MSSALETARPPQPERAVRAPAKAPGPRVLVLSREYPNAMADYVGLWVERWVRGSAAVCQPRVIAPVPYAPPALVPDYYRRFRDVVPHEVRNGVEVFHPRFPIAPGSRLRALEAASYSAGIRSAVDRLAAEAPFDVIHAHFTYPDGVAAIALGRRYDVPVVITEHAPWGPWLAHQPLIRRQMIWAAGRVGAHVPVSRAVGEQIARITGHPERIRVIPAGVDGAEFELGDGAQRRDDDQILFVGHINRVKGVDVLLRAMKQIVARRPRIRLVVIGATLYRAKRSLAQEMMDLARDLGLQNNVEFPGAQEPRELARYMRESSLLVLPSRSESFGCVLVEALACGTPVVATRCGGPEDIVHDGVGRLVNPEDEDALTAGIVDVLDRRAEFDPHTLRAYALENFSWDVVGRRTVALYDELRAVGHVSA